MFSPLSTRCLCVWYGMEWEAYCPVRAWVGVADPCREDYITCSSPTWQAANFLHHPEIRSNCCSSWPPTEKTWVQKVQTFKNSLKFIRFEFWKKLCIFLVSVSYFITVSNLERFWWIWNLDNFPKFCEILNLFFEKFSKQKFEKSSP